MEIKLILSILMQMKNLREKRLKDCKVSKFDQQTISLVDCLMKDLNQINQNKNAFLIQENNEKKLFNLIY
jgi:hypothetical protein